MDVDTTLFSQIGLSEQQGRIYLALLEVGEGSVAEVARRVGLHRAVIYKDLPVLLELGVVSMVLHGKQKRYKAAPLRVLKRIENARSESFLVELEGLMKTVQGTQTPGVQILEGAKGLQQVMEDVLATLKKSDVLYRYSSRDPKTDISLYAPKDYSIRRQAKGFDQYTITNHALKTSSHINRMNRVSKEVPVQEDLFEYNISLLIYGSKVAVVDFDREQAVIHDNQALADFHKRIFLLLYHRL